MRLGILGANGMLGKAVVQDCKERGIDCFICNRYIVDITKESNIRTLLNDRADIVINCAGSIHKGNTYTIDMVNANALGPHLLAEHFRKPIIHVSTDCVFSGIYDAPYPVTFLPDPVDLYGRTKLVGEVKADHVLNVRTSFIGFEHGLLAWLCSHSDWSTIEGWQNAIWSGSTVWAVAEKLVDMALNFTEGGIVHLATKEPIDKYNLLSQLKMLLGLKINIRPVIMPVVDRSLEPTVLLPQVVGVANDLINRYQTRFVANATN